MRRGWGRYRGDAVAAPLGSGPNMRASKAGSIVSPSTIGRSSSVASIAACRWQAGRTAPALSRRAIAIRISDRAVVVSLIETCQQAAKAA